VKDFFAGAVEIWILVVAVEIKETSSVGELWQRSGIATTLRIALAIRLSRSEAISSVTSERMKSS